MMSREVTSADMPTEQVLSGGYIPDFIREVLDSSLQLGIYFSVSEGHHRDIVLRY